jgi:hypothetical protein
VSSMGACGGNAPITPSLRPPTSGRSSRRSSLTGSKPSSPTRPGIRDFNNYRRTRTDGRPGPDIDVSWLDGHSRYA